VSSKRLRFLYDEFGWLRGWVWFATALIGFLGLVGAAGGVTSLAKNHSTHVTCLRVHEETGHPTKVVGKMDATCFIQVNGKWVSYDKYIGMQNLGE
jgi:hypothetical protein